MTQSQKKGSGLYGNMWTSCEPRWCNSEDNNTNRSVRRALTAIFSLVETENTAGKVHRIQPNKYLNGRCLNQNVPNVDGARNHYKYLHDNDSAQTLTGLTWPVITVCVWGREGNVTEAIVIRVCTLF